MMGDEESRERRSSSSNQLTLKQREVIRSLANLWILYPDRTLGFLVEVAAQMGGDTTAKEISDRALYNGIRSLIAKSSDSKRPTK